MWFYFALSLRFPTQMTDDTAPVISLRSATCYCHLVLCSRHSSVIQLKCNILIWHMGALVWKITLPISWSMKLRIQLSDMVTFGLALWSVFSLYGVKQDRNNKKFQNQTRGMAETTLKKWRLLSSEATSEEWSCSMEPTIPSQDRVIFLIK